jgi:hypothetical protein
MIMTLTLASKELDLSQVTKLFEEEPEKTCRNF